MSELPLVTVVTPSYNMAAFVRETIESVLSQDYPRIEYIVMDAGSTDGTLEILKEYQDRLEFHSAPDDGTADAINRGFQRSSGDLFAYLNADDTYLPGAITAAVRHFLDHPEAAVIYGDGYWVDDAGRTLGPYPVRGFNPELLRQECFICQPASFIRRGAFETAGMLDRSLKFTFDYDLWIRIARAYAQPGRAFAKMDRFLATSRMHRSNKTVGQKRGVLRETMSMLTSNYQYVPLHWVCAYACHLVDGKDQFFERTDVSITKYALAFLLGIRHNFRHPARFVKEWSQGLTFSGLVRRCHAFLSSLSR